MELDADFSYSKNVFGERRDNQVTDRSYGASWAVYLWNLTAVEFNYYQSKETTIINDDTRIQDGTIDITRTSAQSIYETYVYGVGIRQAFAKRGARLIPSLSIGYARTFNKSYGDSTYVDNSGGGSFTIYESVSKTRSDNAFAGIALKLSLTQTFSIKGSVKTYFPADDLNKAKDNQKYTAGFSWFF